MYVVKTKALSDTWFNSAQLIGTFIFSSTAQSAKDLL